MIIIQNSQEVKHCFTFIVYNDVHYHIPSVIIFSNGKEEQTKMADASEQTQISEKRYITREREEEENQRDRTSYIIYLSITSFLCNPVLRRTGALSLL